MEKEIIEYFIYGFVLLGLIVEAIEDIREKKIWLPVLFIQLPILIGFNYWIGRGTVLLWIASFGVGALFYLISVITKEQIGKGDALIFCMTGAGVGLLENLLLIYITFVLAFVAAIYMCGVKRVDKRYAMPLAPFVLCSYLIILGYRIMG